MTAFAAGCLGQPGLVERRDLDQVHQLDALHQQRDAVATVHHDRRGGVQVDQRDLDFATIARIDGSRAVDNGKSDPGRQSRAGMHQSDHAERDGDGYAGTDQGPVPGCQFQILGAE